MLSLQSYESSGVTAKFSMYNIHRAILHCVSKTRHPIVTIISSNLTRFSKFFHWWTVCWIFQQNSILHITHHT